MNESPAQFEVSAAYAPHWIVGYMLVALIAFHFASFPAPADSTAPRNPSSWANR